MFKSTQSYSLKSNFMRERQSYDISLIIEAKKPGQVVEACIWMYINSAILTLKILSQANPFLISFYGINPHLYNRKNFQKLSFPGKKLLKSAGFFLNFYTIISSYRFLKSHFYKKLSLKFLVSTVIFSKATVSARQFLKVYYLPLLFCKVHGIAQGVCLGLEWIDCAICSSRQMFEGSSRRKSH